MAAVRRSARRKRSADFGWVAVHVTRERILLVCPHYYVARGARVGVYRRVLGSFCGEFPWLVIKRACAIGERERGERR